MLTPERLRERLRLYVVTDERASLESLVAAVSAAIAGGATAIQLRRKADGGRSLVALGRTLRKLTREADVLFFVNDRVDIALLVEADGVHVGQDDMGLLDVRALTHSSLLVGVSTHTTFQAQAAERDGASYLGVGAIYPTASKPDAVRTGLEGLRAIRHGVGTPLVAIGGITRERVGDVMRAGANGIAVVSAIVSAEDPRLAAVELLDEIESANPEKRTSHFKSGGTS